VRGRAAQMAPAPSTTHVDGRAIRGCIQWYLRCHLDRLNVGGVENTGTPTPVEKVFRNRLTGPSAAVGPPFDVV